MEVESQKEGAENRVGKLRIIISTILIVLSLYPWFMLLGLFVMGSDSGVPETLVGGLYYVVGAIILLYPVSVILVLLLMLIRRKKYTKYLWLHWLIVFLSLVVFFTVMSIFSDEYEEIALNKAILGYSSITLDHINSA